MTTVHGILLEMSILVCVLRAAQNQRLFSRLPNCSCAYCYATLRVSLTPRLLEEKHVHMHKCNDWESLMSFHRCVMYSSSLQIKFLVVEGAGGETAENKGCLSNLPSSPPNANLSTSSVAHANDFRSCVPFSTLITNFIFSLLCLREYQRTKEDPLFDANR